jgi:hypothetical protein
MNITTEQDLAYGLPITMRVPADLKRTLSVEAAQLGVSLSQHGAALLAGFHKTEEANSLRLDSALREKRDLGKSLDDLKDKYSWQTGDTGQVLEILRKNLCILSEAHAKGEHLKEGELRERGFDFRYATHVAHVKRRQYFCVFTMAYRLEGGMVYILSLNSQES